MKLGLCVGLIILCGFLGYGIATYYKERKKFFFDISNFLSQLKTDISFNSHALQKIINDKLSTSVCKTFKTLLENYTFILNNNLEITDETLFKQISIINTDEKESMLCFFKKLGKLDVFSQVDEIDKVYKINSTYLESANLENKKYSSLYVKLGIIIGAFVSLMII